MVEGRSGWVVEREAQVGGRIVEKKIMDFLKRMMESVEKSMSG